jgi:hypothetical protein
MSLLFLLCKAMCDQRIRMINAVICFKVEKIKGMKMKKKFLCVLKIIVQGHRRFVSRYYCTLFC